MSVGEVLFILGIALMAASVIVFCILKAVIRVRLKKIKEQLRVKYGD